MSGRGRGGARRRARRSGLAAAFVVALAGCAGDGARPAAGGERAIALTVRFDDGAGRVARGTLTCRAGVRRATGVARPASLTCVRVRRIKSLLLAAADPGRACTLIYGGPQTARVTGRLDGRRVDRRFARTDGCEIADHGRLARAFGR